MKLKPLITEMIKRIIKEESSEDNKYDIVNGTAYYKGTDKKVIDALEYAMKNHIRIVIDYGDPNTGKSWGERYDIRGTVGRSTGTYKIPLLINNSRSMGGPGISTKNIISIKKSSGGQSLYQHPKYQPYQE